MTTEMCLICAGTGGIRCTHCGGNGINLNSSLLGDACRACKGTGREICQACKGTGAWSVDLEKKRNVGVRPRP